MATVQLPSISWGSKKSKKRALLVHGLGSDSHTMWQIGEFLGSKGWLATAVDQRGHGIAPRASRYRIEDYAADLLEFPRGGSWDVAIGHSIAGASLVLAETGEPDFAKRLILIDPALHANETGREGILQGQTFNHLELTIAEQTERNPHWHPQDIELSVRASKAASLFALQHSVLDNPDWDVLNEAKKITAPTLVVQGDPKVLARYTNEHAEMIEAANHNFSRTMIPGTGHNPHRDQPKEFCERIGEWLAKS